MEQVREESDSAPLASRSSCRATSSGPAARALEMIVSASVCQNRVSLTCLRDSGETASHDFSGEARVPVFGLAP